MKVAVVAIGSEITAGEVVNSNASWLSVQLEQLGFEVTHHMAVPDDERLMLKAFDQLNEDVELLVTTGGLGPTTDDFTAKVVSEWVKQPFVFNEDVWQKLQNLLNRRGLKVREAHKTQCWFPEKAEIFENPVGSACGFFAEADTKKILVLPGPPREIQGMWQQHVESYLKSFPVKDKKILKKWTCLGIPESELAEITEKLFEGSQVTLGYRASVPYVQLKAWFHSGEELEAWSSRVKDAIGEWLVTEDGEDPIKNWSSRLPLGRLEISDSVSKGFLSSRLWESDLAENFALVTSENFFRDEALSEKTVFFLNTNATGVEVEAGVWSDTIRAAEKISLPYKIPMESKRGQKYFTEMAFQIWAKMLGSRES